MKKFNTNAVVISLLIIFSVITLSLPAIAYSSPGPVSLGTASNFAILAGSAVTGTGTNSVTGDVGLSSTTGAAITLLTCSELTGSSKIYDVDNAYVGGGEPGVLCLNNPFDGTAAAAKADLASAYADAASIITHPVDSTIAHDLGGQTLTTGVYDSDDTTFTNSGTLTLNAEGVTSRIFILKAGSSLITSSSSHVVLINGAKASNVFWVVGSSATLGSSSDLTGTIMAVTSITLNTSATVTGRLLADADNNIAGAVTLDGDNTVLLDTSDPTSTITSPGTASYSASTTIALTGTSADTNLSSTTISVDSGSFVATVGTAAAWTYSAIGLAQGAHTFQSKATDTSGNTVLSTIVDVTVDTAAPFVILSSVTSNPTNGLIAVTAQFSENVTGFLAGDIVIGNGAVENFIAVDGDTYTFNVNPSDGANVAVTIDVPITTSIDVAGNANTASNQLAYTSDTVPPSVILSSVTSNPTNGLIAVTAQFSENVTGFLAGDIIIGNGAVENFIAVDGDTYTFNVNPSDGASVAVTIDVPITTSIDAAGNANTASNQLAYTSDTIAPNVGIVLGDNALKIGDTSLLTFTFSETAIGFTIADITGFPNGTLSAFTATADPLVYTTLFTPSATTEDLFNVITVGIGWTDAEGNTPISTTDSANYAVDTIAPTVIITDDEPGTADISGGDIIYTFTFSEGVLGFVVGDVTVVGGSKAGAFASGIAGDTIYTLVITPNSNSTTNITVDITAAIANDPTENDNTAAIQSVQAVDTIVPPSGGGGGGSFIQPKIVPSIGILKVPSSSILPAGTNDITYDYTVWNIKGKQSLSKISVTDEICSPITYLSGDLNNNGKLDPLEKWKYSCSTTLSKTTTNTSTAIGYSSTSNKAVTATATSTVVVENNAENIALSNISVFSHTPTLPNAGFPPNPLQLPKFRL